MTRHISTCTLCEASCGILVDEDNGTVTGIRGDPDDPLSRGHICPKAVALKDLHTDPDRLRRPMLREGTTWHELDWDTAFDLAASRLDALRTTYGRDALGLYLGNPVIHNLGAMVMTPLFMNSLNTPNRFSATSVDQLPQMVSARAMFGHQLLVPVPDLERTDHLILFGANPAASNGSLMTAPGITDRLDQIKARGKVILIDPRRTESARHATEHHFIRPGTDALALLAMAHVIFAEKLANLGKCAAFTDGLTTLASVARRFPPERVAARTGLSADTIRRLAREFSTTPRAALYGRLGISTQAYGTLASLLIFALNAITNHLDVPGGVMFPTPAIDGLELGRVLPPATFGRKKSRVRQLPDFGGEFPVATLADEIETPGQGQIRGLVTVAGNPVLSAPNGRRVGRALAGLDFYLAIDPYLNETTRHAHLILPPASPLERAHYDMALYHFAVRNVAKYTPAVFKRPADSREDWEILSALATRLSRRPGLRNRTQNLAIRTITKLGLRRVLDLALRTGPRGIWPFGESKLTIKTLEANPHGLDLGPLQETLPGRLRTKDRRIELAPGFIVDDIPRLERELDTPPAALEMIGRRHLRSNNTWLHNSNRLMKGKSRCTLMMHPDDATTRGFTNAQTVLVKTTIGQVSVELEITDTIMPGVVSMPHGFGHTSDSRLSVATSYPGASHNDLTDEHRIDAISGNAAFSGTPVDVLPAPAAANGMTPA